MSVECVPSARACLDLCHLRAEHLHSLHEIRSKKPVDRQTFVTKHRFLDRVKLDRAYYRYCTILVVGEFEFENSFTANCYMYQTIHLPWNKYIERNLHKIGRTAGCEKFEQKTGQQKTIFCKMHNYFGTTWKTVEVTKGTKQKYQHMLATKRLGIPSYGRFKRMSKQN